MDRYFEKISFNQFQKDIKDDIKLYNEYKLPERKTNYSAGYDFFAVEDFELQPGEIKKVPTGYKAKFLSDEMLLIIIRSSVGFKYNVRMTNQVGLIDADFYNNPENEGHMFISLQNEGNQVFRVKKGESYVQGIFVKYLTCGDKVDKIRDSWSGNPQKKEGNENE